MPFGACLKLFKKTAGDMAEQYGGAGARNLVEDGIEKVAASENEAGAGGGGADIFDLLGSFTGKQQGGLKTLFDAVGGSAGGVEDKAAEKGMDPALIQGVMSMLTGGGGAGGASGGEGGGFNLGSLLKVAQSLTKGGAGGGAGGGFDGFISLLGGLGGGGADGAGNTNNILKVLVGLAKSFFAMQSGKNPAIQDWGVAGADANKDDNNFTNWGLSLIKDLIFKGKKQKDKIDGDPTGKEADKGKIKGWFDDHPEIGKMQKDIFDDVFDTTDDDEDVRKDDPAPLIPTPTGFTPDCSVLDNASILFLNTNILLELRKEWRFLYSTRTHSKSFSDFVDAIEFQGPTIILARSSDGENMVGAFASTSWAPTEGGWIGNGDSFVFAIKPKMAVFYATGKNENFLYLDRNEGLGLGGKPGHFGFGISASMETVTYNEEVDTFDLPNLFPKEFEFEHLEAWGLGAAPNQDSERSKVFIRRPNLAVRGGDVDLDDLADQLC